MYLIYQHLVGETVIHLESCYMIILFFSKYRQNFKNAVIFASIFFFLKKKNHRKCRVFLLQARMRNRDRLSQKAEEGWGKITGGNLL